MTGPVLRVHLDRLAANLAAMRRRIAPSELLLVVKDDAYGHGLDAVVDRALAEGVRWFGVSDIATGLRVRRRVGGGPRILVWAPAGGAGLGDAVAADLDLGVGERATLAAVAAAATAAGGAAARVHLEIDTGLHRSGARAEDLTSLFAAAVGGGAIEVVGIFSHLAEASDEDDDAARALFDDAVTAARAAGLRPEVLHLTASAASAARPELRYDLCRIGAFAYGIRSEGVPGGSQPGIAPVAALEAEVVAVGGGAVTLGIGATHGIPSLLGRRLRIATPDGRRRVEHVGDHTTLVEPWPSAAVGDVVVLWGAGAELSATDAAELIGTIGEEIVVRVAPRVPRRYV